jgi:hypothetical protein
MAHRLTRPDDLGSGEFLDQLEAAMLNEGVEIGGSFYLAGQPEKESLPQHARTRAGDPRSSREAARRIGDLNAKQIAVYRYFLHVRQPMTDEELDEGYPAYALENGLPMMRPGQSTARSRRSELHKAHWIINTGDRKLNSAGNLVILWGLPPEDIPEPGLATR